MILGDREKLWMLLRLHDVEGLEVWHDVISTDYCENCGALCEFGEEVLYYDFLLVEDRRSLY